MAKAKLSKDEKKELKAQKKLERKEKAATPEGIESRKTIWKSVTAVICVGALCFTTSGAIGKYCDAIAAVAEKEASVAALKTNTVAVGGQAASDAPVAADPTADVADPAADVDSAADPAATDAEPAADGNKADANDPTTFDKAQVVAYYNKCLKDSYAKKVNVKKTETIGIKVDKASGGDIVVNFVNNTILPKYAGTKDYDRDFENGIHGEQKLTEFASPYSLTADGAKTATITKSGDNYVIKIEVVAETSTLDVPPKYNQMCSHPLDLATVDISPAKVTKADFTYPGTTLTATVDANGKVIATSINQPLSGTGEGKLGITLSATLSGYLSQTCKYTYK